MHLNRVFNKSDDDGDDDDEDDGDDQSDCDDDGGDGQLPWESTLHSKCRPSVDQVDTKQRVGPTWARSLPGLHLVFTWFHLVHLVCIHQLVFICHAHPMPKSTSNLHSVFFTNQIREMHLNCHAQQMNRNHKLNSTVWFQADMNVHAWICAMHRACSMCDVRRTVPECTRGPCMQTIVCWLMCLCTVVHLLCSCPPWSPCEMHI